MGAFGAIEDDAKAVTNFANDLKSRGVAWQYLFGYGFRRIAALRDPQSMLQTKRPP